MVGPEETKHCLAWQVPQERPLQFSHSGLIPSDSGGEFSSIGNGEVSFILSGGSASTGKEDSSE